MRGTGDIPGGREDVFSDFKEKGVAGSTISSMGKSALFAYSAFGYVTRPISVAAPLASGWIINRVKKNISNKEEITELTKELERIKNAFENDLIWKPFILVL